MFYLYDVPKLNGSIIELERVAASLSGNRREAQGYAVDKGVEVFFESIKANAGRLEVVENFGLRQQLKDPNEQRGGFYEGYRADVLLDGGTLSFFLELYEQRGAYGADLQWVDGSQALTPVVWSKLLIESSEGKALQKNLEGVVDQAREILEFVDNDILCSWVASKFEDYNSKARGMNESIKATRRAIREVSKSVNDNIMAEAEGTANAIFEKIYNEGYTREELAKFREDSQYKVELRSTGKLVECWGVRNEFVTLLSGINEDGARVRVLPPKRKNSKHLDIQVKYPDGEWFTFSRTEREGFEFDVKAIARHLSIKDMAEKHGTFILD